MGNCNFSREKMIENLRDAGCDDSTINNYFSAVESGNKKEAAHCLEKHREQLLKHFHECSDCIDCLDYFITQTQKND